MKDGSWVLTGYCSTARELFWIRLENLSWSKKNQGLKLFRGQATFASCCLFHLTGYLKNDSVPFDKPEVLSSCSADWLLVHEVRRDQKCNKLEFPNRHQGATCPDSAGPVYFSTLHFSLETNIANHPYLGRKQSTNLKFSFYNLENKKKILILAGSHQQKKHWYGWKIFVRVIPSINFFGSIQS